MINTSLPLTDLHRHLDGNIRPQTILGLGRQFGVALPATTFEALRPHVQVIVTEPDLVSFLQKLDVGVSVLESLDACQRVAQENVADAVAVGLDYTELRFSPYFPFVLPPRTLSTSTTWQYSSVSSVRNPSR